MLPGVLGERLDEEEEGLEEGKGAPSLLRSTNKIFCG